MPLPLSLETIQARKYGRLTVLSEGVPLQSTNPNHHPRTMLCICDCGEHVTHPLKQLREGKARSCGQCPTPEAQREAGGRTRKGARLLTHKGETLSVADWGRRLEMEPKTILARLNLGWDIRRTLETPPRPRKKALRRDPGELPRLERVASELTALTGGACFLDPCPLGVPHDYALTSHAPAPVGGLHYIDKPAEGVISAAYVLKYLGA